MNHVIPASQPDDPRTPSLIPHYMSLARLQANTPPPCTLLSTIQTALDLDPCIDDCNTHATTLVNEATHHHALLASAFSPRDYDVVAEDRLSDPRRTKLLELQGRNCGRTLGGSGALFERVAGLVGISEVEGEMGEVKKVTPVVKKPALTLSPPTPSFPVAAAKVPTRLSRLPKRAISPKNCSTAFRIGAGSGKGSGKSSRLVSRIPVASH